MILVDVEQLLNRLYALKEDLNRLHQGAGLLVNVNQMIDFIDSSPKFPLEVVRCKDCKHREDNITCYFMDFCTDDYGFCHHGEKKDDK